MASSDGRPGRCIDVHAHIIPTDLPAMSDASWPTLVIDGTRGQIFADGELYRTVDEQYWSTKRRLALLDELGIDVQVISPLPVLLAHRAPVAEAAGWCRRINELVAEAVGAGRGRLLGLGILPSQDVEAASAELEHVLELGLVGVELSTAIDDVRTLGDPAADPLLAVLAARDVPVLVHPVRRGLVTGLPPSLEAAVGLPLDTTLALLPRLAAGVAPMPRSCVAHGGGTLPWVLPRRAGIGGSPEDPTPGWLLVDTAACDLRQIRYLVDRFGPEAVLFGTDCPAAPLRTVQAQIAALRAMPDHGAAILGGNAEELLGLVPHRAAAPSTGRP